MKIGNREQSDDAQNNSVNLNIQSEINAYKKLFDSVIIVEPVDMLIISTEGTSLKQTGLQCNSVCPLYKDKCGCICKDSISANEVKTRFSFNKKDAHLIMCRPIKLRYRTFTLVNIKRIDPSFSFGATDVHEAVQEITNLGSNLVIDALTRIYNRKYLLDNIEYSINESVIKHRHLSIACIDIDNFKQFNDNYGHEFGDKVLKMVAKSMEMSVASIDGAYPVRIGGDEFVIVANGLTKQRFKMIMTKLCQVVQSSGLNYNGKKVGVCISIGVAEVLEDNATSYKELYDIADKQLYKAKEAGKGCVR